MTRDAHSPKPGGHAGGTTGWGARRSQRVRRGGRANAGYLADVVHRVGRLVVVELMKREATQVRGCAHHHQKEHRGERGDQEHAEAITLAGGAAM